VAEFLRGQLHPDGGFQDRAGASDLYYTVFGMEGLLALRAAPPLTSLRAHLRGFGASEDLDFVHLSCLARGWAGLPADVRAAAPCREVARRVEAYRSVDGGYADEPGSEHGSLYGCFLALGAYQDLGLELPDPL